AVCACPTTGEPFGAPDPSSSHDRPYSRPWRRFTLEHAIGRSEGVELTAGARSARRAASAQGWLAKPRRGASRRAGTGDVPGAPAALVRQCAVPRHLPRRAVRDRDLGGGGPAGAVANPSWGGRGAHRAELLRRPLRVRCLAGANAAVAGDRASAEAPGGGRSGRAVDEQTAE